MGVGEVVNRRHICGEKGVDLFAFGKTCIFNNIPSPHIASLTAIRRKRGLGISKLLKRLSKSIFRTAVSRDGD
jgi:hypothetical protein